MNKEALRFCRRILKEVSRSFSLTIPMLDSEIKNAVMVVYLQDRLLDNFEDELPELEDEKRKKLMDKVIEVFNPAHRQEPPVIQEIQGYSDDFIDDSLKVLTANVDLLWEAYHGLDSYVKARSFFWLKEMNSGMQKYLDKDIKTFSDLDEYCYYVAGTVGGFLSDLIINKYSVSQKKAGVLKDNFNQAGLFLQKVNITRDIREDILNRDRIFWPLPELELKREQLLSKDYKDKAMTALSKMIKNIEKHVPALIKYYNALPDDASGYKRFFAVNNALGLATIDRLRNNQSVFYSSKPVKASKLEFMAIMKSPERKLYEFAEGIDL